MRLRRDMKPLQKSNAARSGSASEGPPSAADYERPSVLDDLGIAAAIEWQAAQFEKHAGFATRVSFGRGEPVISRESAVAIFRAVQESPTNVARHARADGVHIILKREGRVVRVSVEDNGKGITEAEINDVKSLGIKGLKERITRVGGEFHIFSEPGKGTRLDIIIPRQND